MNTTIKHNYPNGVILIGVGSTSTIKCGAVADAIRNAGMLAAVHPIAGSSSCVNEQPVGFDEALNGAGNRIWSAMAINRQQAEVNKMPTCDYYIGIENYIYQHQETWYDRAVVAIANRNGDSNWVSSSEVELPSAAVVATKYKPGGFAENTVGKTLQEMGLVTLPDDPHLGLTGISRREILRLAILHLLQSTI